MVCITVIIFNKEAFLDWKEENNKKSSSVTRSAQILSHVRKHMHVPHANQPANVVVLFVAIPTLINRPAYNLHLGNNEIRKVLVISHK